MDAISELIAEYKRWNDAEGLDLGSADEHLNDPDLSEVQREWLEDFVRRWNLAANEERVRRMRP